MSDENPYPSAPFTKAAKNVIAIRAMEAVSRGGMIESSPVIAAQK
ncbi:MAG TPA: hypothetical protein VI319_10665 [Burkholderiales bacterium]